MMRDENNRHIQEISTSTRWVFYAKLSNAVLSVLFIAYLARVMSTGEIATYAILTIFASWSELFTGFGFGTILQQKAAELITRKRFVAVKGLIASSLIYRAAANFILFALVLAVWSLGLTDRFRDNFSVTIILLYIACLPSVGLSFLAGVQGAVQRFNRRAQISIATSFLQKGLAVFGFYQFGMEGFFSGFAIGTTFGLVMTLYDIRNYLTVRVYGFRTLLRRTYKFYGLGYFNSVVDKVDRPLIGILIGAEGLAIYHLAKGLYENINGLAKAMLLPALVKIGDVKGLGKEIFTSYIFGTLTVLLFVFVPLGFFIMSSGRLIVTVLYGESYQACATILSAFGLLLVARFLWLFLRGIVLRTCSLNSLVVTEVATSLTIMSLYLILVPEMGAVGIPFALIIGTFFGLTLFALVLRSREVIRLSVGHFANAFLLGLVIAVVVWFWTLDREGFWGLTIAIASAGLVYLFWMSRFFPKQYLESYVVYFNLSRFFPDLKSA